MRGAVSAGRPQSHHSVCGVSVASERYQAVLRQQVMHVMSPFPNQEMKSTVLVMLGLLSSVSLSHTVVSR